MLVTALLALVVVPILAVVLLVVVVAAGPDVPEWLPPAVALAFAALTAALLSRARGASTAASIGFAAGAVLVGLGLVYLLILGLVEAIEGPGGV